MQKIVMTDLANRLLFIIGVIFVILTIFIAFDPLQFIQFGYFGVFVFNLFGPGTLLIPLIADHFNVVLLALVSAIGMSLNDSVVYVIGRSGQSVVKPGKRSDKVRDWVIKHGRLGLFSFSLLPLPIDVVGGTVGYLSLPYSYYIVPTFAGKFLRFLALGLVVIWFF